MKYRIQFESDSIKLYNTILILSNDQIIEIIIKNDKEEEIEDESSIKRSFLCKEALNVIVTLNNFLLQSNNAMLKLLSALQKN